MLSRFFKRSGKAQSEDKRGNPPEPEVQNERILHNSLVPCVLVVGDFQETDSIEFAKSAWKAIEFHYRDEGAFFGPPPLPAADSREPNNFHPVPFDQNKNVTESSCLFPIPVNDFGRATGPSFQMHIFELFKTHNVVGIISCGTAETNIGLADALRFIDVPVLIVLDSTLDGPERFVPHARELITGNTPENDANTEHLAPNALQLIPNNALQAQAILSKVGVLSTNKQKPIVQLLCFPSDDPYVKDLRSAVESNVEETNRSRIRLEAVDLNHFQIKRNSVLLCLGYNEILGLIEKPIKNCELLLSDGFDKRAAGYPVIEVAHYYQVRPVFDPLLHALDAYKVFNRLWRDSQDRNPDDLQIRLRSKIQCIRDLLEREYGERYRFVGATNQRGGFYAEKKAPKRTRRFLRRRRENRF